MIKDGIEILLDNFQRLSGNGAYWFLYLISVLFAICFIKERKNKYSMSVFSIVSVLVITNPIVVYVVDKVLEGDSVSVYWRMFWIIPLGFSIAYMFTEIVFMADNMYSKIIATVGFIFIIIISGKYIYTIDIFQKTNNYYKIPDEQLAVINILSSQSKEGERIKVYVPPEMIARVRQIDSKLVLGYGRNVMEYYYFIDEYQKYIVEGNTNLVIKSLRDAGYKYFAWDKNIPFESYEGVEFISMTENYKVFRLLTVEEIKQNRIEKGESLDGIDQM